MKRKQIYWNRLLSLLDEYTQILIVGADNVGSNHMQQIRKSLRGDAEILMGKNTVMRTAIRSHLVKNPKLENLLPLLKGNVGFVFTTGSLAEIRKRISENKIGAPAKTGSIAPCNVLVPKGPTGMEPTKTSFFQALQIQTRINKGQIEITNDVPLLTMGEKVTASQAELLKILNIHPFSYGLNVQYVYSDGTVYDAAVLDLTDEDLIQKFYNGVNNVAALSLEIGVPTVASVPHSLRNAYKNLLALSISSEYTFEEAKELKDLLSDPEKLAALQAGAAATAAAAAAPDEPEVEEDQGEAEDVDLGGGLFGGDEEGY